MRRSMLAPLVLTAALALSAGPALAAEPVTVPGSVSCVGATIRGTAGADVLVGTPAPDVIDAGDGQDVVYGLGGDDRICGGEGADQLFGGPGADTVDGGNAPDLVVGEDGRDVLQGGRGDDRVFGAGDDDALDGADGADVVGGGSGADRVGGSAGADALTGGAGADTATGGPASDTCAAETAQTCEVTGPSAQDVVAALQVPEGPSHGSIPVTVTASATRGVALLLLEVNGRLVQHRLVDPPAAGPVSAVMTVAGDDLPNGRVQLTVVALDRDGNEVRSAGAVVHREQAVDLEGATVLASLIRPTRLSELAAVLRLVDADVVEFRHVREGDEPRVVPSGVATRAAAQGVVVDPGGTALVGGFYGRGLALEDQLAVYAGLSREADGDPRVTAIRFEDMLDQRRRALLAPFVSGYVTVPGRDGYEPTAPEQPAAHALRAAPAKPTSLEEAYPDAPQPAARAALSDDVVTDVDEDVFWPTFGQLDTTERVEHISRPFWFDSENHRVTFDHDLVWVPGVLDHYGTLDRAYEHDLKISTDRLTVGVRPFCEFVNPLVGWDDAFYAYREDGVAWETNVPDGADPYFDTDVSDGCGTEDLSVGIRTPEILDDGLAEGHATHFWFSVDAANGEPETGDFTYMSQRLSRSSDPVCFVIGTSNCTGLDAGAGNGGFIVRTEGELIPGVTLPACLTWEWDADPSLSNNDTASRCGGDSDGDGWDDTVDCSPGDPAINPGAVDVPNDGIDQNCDGSDLVVGEGSIRFTLVWDNDNDQDLHVIEPDGTRIWYGGPGPSSTGGRLDRDDNVAVCGVDSEPGGVENTYWPDEYPAPIGTYSVEVRQYSSCGTPASWTLQVYANDRLEYTSSGTGNGVVTYAYDGDD